MPKDKKWFEENPKVSAYISPDLKERLDRFMKERKIEKVSQALTVVLQEFLGVVQSVDQTNLSFIQNDRLEVIEGKLIASLK